MSLTILFARLGFPLVLLALTVPRTSDGQSDQIDSDSKILVEGVPVSDVLKRLNAKMEKGLTQSVLQGYTRQFDQTDTNQDGKHSRQEYVVNGRYLSPQARAGIFAAADDDNDKMVSRDEYILNRLITDEAKAILQRMNDNRNGRIEQAEFLLHASELLKDKQLATAVFRKFDGNRDQALAVPEYLRVWGQWARDGQPSPSKRVLSAKANPKQSAPGQSNPRLLPGRSFRPSTVSPPSVATVMKRFDNNQDGKLQQAEIPQRIRQFILPADTNGDKAVTEMELKLFRQKQASQKRPGSRPNKGSETDQGSSTDNGRPKR
ncbi:MAG: hypothetical protein P8M80_05335 [Pirellulaceae bacterium]|nr:hypothetical protein [Pirellulaceae bacterium]